MKLAIQAAGKTDVGLVRANNEDNFGYDVREGIFVVCDGMGGQAAGETASKIAVETVLKCFQQDHGVTNSHVLGRGFEEVSERANALGNAVQLANQAIQEAAARNPGQSGMGSTIVAVCTGGSQFSIANVGDSRIYLIRGDAIQQLTSDHSLVMEQVRRGLMTMEEAEKSEMQNVIVRALGTEESVEPDLEDHEFVPGDLLVLCSDGLSRYVKENTILETIRSTENLDEACAKLIEAAKSGGSDDNITCLLVRAREQDQSWGGRLRNLISPANNSRHGSS
ncbi:MAG: Stp1/IreP family PP2C-type Ser/Thr phosphatase [Acidobacteria bacterium]|nr:MAG: Stp1/IreP family PP2C-type Ser/Thr phosphatase [Acidobacteriota bacterium]